MRVQLWSRTVEERAPARAVGAALHLEVAQAGAVDYHRVAAVRQRERERWVSAPFWVAST
jgi:hypothetical protein